MLFGTSFLFRIAYFFTSFSPALLLLSLNFRLKQEFCSHHSWLNHILGFLTYWLFPIATIIIAIIAACYLKSYLIRRQKAQRYEVPNLALNFDASPKNFKDSRVLHM